MTASWYEEYERGEMRHQLFPFPGDTPLERRFKAAGMALVAEGLYPSARQIKKRLGYDVSGKVHLNGAQCSWLREIREFFNIAPCVNWTRRRHRHDWEIQLGLINSAYGPAYPYKLERAKDGTLRVIEGYLDNRMAEKKAAERARYAGFHTTGDDGIAA